MEQELRCFFGHGLMTRFSGRRGVIESLRTSASNFAASAGSPANRLEYVRTVEPRGGVDPEPLEGLHRVAFLREERRDLRVLLERDERLFSDERNCGNVDSGVTSEKRLIALDNHFRGASGCGRAGRPRERDRGDARAERDQSRPWFAVAN